MTTQDNSKTFSSIIFVFSLLGALLFLLEDFAGWTEKGYYYSSYYVSLGSSFLPIYAYVLLLLNFAGLVGLSVLGYQMMQHGLTHNRINQGLKVSLAVLVLTLGGGVFFMLMAADAPESWLDTGFYASLVASGVDLFFFNKLNSFLLEK